MLRVQTANPASPKEVRLVRTSVNAGVVVEHFTDPYPSVRRGTASAAISAGPEASADVVD